MERKNLYQRFTGHLKTINTHRHLVMFTCFKCGMYEQGLKHDLSKYSPVEFIPSVRYFQGNRSPIGEEKKQCGYSLAWLHHKGRNRHHWEYWTDRLEGSTQVECIEMPFRYMLESVIDRICASKVYMKENYSKDEPLRFFLNSKEIHVMHKNTAAQITYLLKYLSEHGEEKALAYYKSLYKKHKNDKTITLE